MWSAGGRLVRSTTMAQSYKTLKEEFVSNLSGSSVSEINYVTAIAPVSTNDLEAVDQD